MFCAVRGCQETSIQQYSFLLVMIFFIRHSLISFANSFSALKNSSLNAFLTFSLLRSQIRISFICSSVPWFPIFIIFPNSMENFSFLNLGDQAYRLRFRCELLFDCSHMAMQIRVSCLTSKASMIFCSYASQVWHENPGQLCLMARSRQLS